MLLYVGSTSQPCKFEQNTITGFQHIRLISNVPEPDAYNDKIVTNTSSAMAATDIQFRQTAYSSVQPPYIYSMQFSRKCVPYGQQLLHPEQRKNNIWITK
jgi:hypothetical protein